MNDIEQQRLQVLANCDGSTRAVREGHQRTPEGEHGEPIFTTSSFVFDSAQAAAARFSGADEGNVYSRYTNPTVRNFEQRIAALEGAEQGVATASGMAAILSTCLALLKSGDHVLCSQSVFGTTTTVFGKYLQKFGVQTDFIASSDVAVWDNAINKNTKLLFLETPSNPLAEVFDIAAIAKLAKAQGALLVVDNCFCTPALQKPLDFGADIVVHSATKFLDGQGRCLGGVVVGSQEHMREVLAFIRSAGPSMSPFNAWVFVKGLETLSLRMQAQSAAAFDLAHWLQKQSLVERVYYTGLVDHPGHELAKQQQKAFGAVLAFEVKGGKEKAWQFIDATRLMSITANLGDTKTTIVHPATTTHGRLSNEQKTSAGIKDNLIRISVGLEHVDDLKADLLRGFQGMV